MIGDDGDDNAELLALEEGKIGEGGGEKEKKKKRKGEGGGRGSGNRKYLSI